MNKLCSTIQVPGKLMIAGEYAVLEPGIPAVVVAVNRYITATIKPSQEYRLSLPQLGLESLAFYYNKEEGIQFSIQDKRLCFIKNAMNTVFEYLIYKGIIESPFQLYIESDLNDPVTKQKYGLGSSAAIVVAVTASILHYFDQLEIVDKMQLFQLAAISHLKTQGNGSCGDIAACVYGGWIRYESFDPNWLLGQISERKSIYDLLQQPWPNLYIEPMEPPIDLKLLVGWTNESVGTAPMVNKVLDYKDMAPKLYMEFLKESKASVMDFIDGFHNKDCNKVLDALYRNRMVLLNLGKKSLVEIETNKLKKLCHIADKYGRGKTSGAGGGDCGIAMINQSSSDYKAVWAEWESVGIKPLDLEVVPGCRVIED